MQVYYCSPDFAPWESICWSQVSALKESNRSKFCLHYHMRKAVLTECFWRKQDGGRLCLFCQLLSILAVGIGPYCFELLLSKKLVCTWKPAGGMEEAFSLSESAHTQLGHTGNTSCSTFWRTLRCWLESVDVVTSPPEQDRFWELPP